MKRVIDTLIALALLVLVLPVLVVLAIAIAIQLRAWPFFSHERIGRDGTPFRMIKLRTLPTSTPRFASKYELPGPQGLPWLCRTLRRMHLDELPQLLLVAKGTMSLVGPRPEMAVLHHGLEPGFAAARTSVRPGCTGLWQISVASGRLIGESPKYDLAYLRTAGWRMDAWIVWRTFTMFLGRPPVDIDEIPAWVLGSGRGSLLLADAA